MPIDPQTEVLLIKSAQDRECMNYPLPSDNFGFNAQQAVEKLLKALIAAHGHAYPLSHNLGTLKSQLIGLAEVLPELPCRFAEFEPYAVSFRYDESQHLSDVDRQRFIDTVDGLRAFVLERVATLSA